MAVTEPGIEVAHRIGFGSAFTRLRKHKLAHPPAFSIGSETPVRFGSGFTHYRRNKATPAPGIEIGHRILRGDPFMRIPPKPRLFSPSVLIDVVVAPSAPGDSSVEIVYNIPGRLRIRPRLLAPPNGSQHRLGSPVMIWTPTVEAAYYEVHVALDDRFTKRVARFNVVGSELQRGFVFGGTYYWRVRAVAGSAYSDYSQVWRFSVPALLPGAVDTHPEDGGFLLLTQFRKDA